ncbi:MAG: IMPACT family protein [Bacteroidales bacterium]|jgi:uncharacterized YigZ family protein|nr:YigZ family protein [Bacteroidales bacterium]
MFDESYNTILKASEGSFRDKGSKFIAYLFPVTTEDEVKEILQDYKKKYYDARHHCYAYRLGWNKDAYRINDDGEPSGTAGKPIYGQILSNDLTNVLILVVRYFGGVKLGVSGLIQAYKAAAADAIENNKIVVTPIRHLLKIEFGYPHMNQVMSLLKVDEVKIQKSDYTNDGVIIELTVEKKIVANLEKQLLDLEGLSLKLLDIF